ncbi:MAG: hypothetical protein Kapaf2KO_23230 [Candidatus Kapaibacteriales bacterium]
MKTGDENIPKEGGILLVGNHQSLIDWVFVILSMDRPVKFVIAEQYYNIAIFRPIFKWAGLIPISTASSKRAIIEVKRALDKGEAVAIFPEGQLTRNGQIGTFKKGFELIARLSDCRIVPFYIHGLWGSFFSHCNSFFRITSKRSFKRTVSIGFHKPLPKSTNTSTILKYVRETSIGVVTDFVSNYQPLPVLWLKRAKLRPTSTGLVNFDGKKFKNSKLVIAVLLFIDFIKKQDIGNDRIGIFLPASSGSAITNMAAMAAGKSVVNLNYTSGPEVLKHCVEDSGVKTIYTSKVFLEKLRTRGLESESAFKGLEIVYLEKISSGTSKKTLVAMAVKILGSTSDGLIKKFFTLRDNKEEAALLYSSGSEGKPKGVVLTGQNLLANTHQISLFLANIRNEVILNSLPPFHAFGLTVTTLFPMVEGIKQVCCPDPTDPSLVSNLVKENSCTVMFATPTFLGIYAKSNKTAAEDFASLRFVVSGAEKLREETRYIFESKFGKRINEGFGTTECSPVTNINLPDYIGKDNGVVQMSQLVGSIGQPLLGTAERIVDPDTNAELPIGEAGMLAISGPQVMKEYLGLPEKTSDATFVSDGIRWYRTGDKAEMNEHGFIRIVDRYSRFAKIGGEMISLSTVEQGVLVAMEDPEAEVTVCSLPHPDRGEELVLLVSNTKHTIAELKGAVSGSKLSPLQKPKKVVLVEEIPKLGSGKVDYSNTKKLAMSLSN